MKIRRRRQLLSVPLPTGGRRKEGKRRKEEERGGESSYSIKVKDFPERTGKRKILFFFLRKRRKNLEEFFGHFFLDKKSPHVKTAEKLRRFFVA